MRAPATIACLLSTGALQRMPTAYALQPCPAPGTASIGVHSSGNRLDFLWTGGRIRPGADEPRDESKRTKCLNMDFAFHYYSTHDHHEAMRCLLDCVLQADTLRLAAGLCIAKSMAPYRP